MKLPKHYETAGLPGHDGTVWFRRAIDAQVGRGGKPIGLQLGAIDDMDMTFFNGHFLGGTETLGFGPSSGYTRCLASGSRRGRTSLRCVSSTTVGAVA